jgi:hypothetical protein
MWFMVKLVDFFRKSLLEEKIFGRKLMIDES